jgi:hypothetical protein
LQPGRTEPEAADNRDDSANHGADGTSSERAARRRAAAVGSELEELVDGEAERDERGRRPDPRQQRALVRQKRAVRSETVRLPAITTCCESARGPSDRAAASSVNPGRRSIRKLNRSLHFLPSLPSGPALAAEPCPGVEENVRRRKRPSPLTIQGEINSMRRFRFHFPGAACGATAGLLNVRYLWDSAAKSSFEGGTLWVSLTIARFRS